MVAHICDPSTQGPEAGESVVHGHPLNYSKFKAILCDVRPHLTNTDRHTHKQREEKRKLYEVRVRYYGGSVCAPQLLGDRAAVSFRAAKE